MVNSIANRSPIAVCASRVVTTAAATGVGCTPRQAERQVLDLGQARVGHHRFGHFAGRRRRRRADRQSGHVDARQPAAELHLKTVGLVPGDRHVPAPIPGKAASFAVRLARSAASVSLPVSVSVCVPPPWLKVSVPTVPLNKFRA